MPQYELTIDDEMLHGLFQKDEGLPKLLEAVLNQMPEAQVTDHLKSMPYEPSEERKGYRNGYPDREMKTRVRDGGISMELFGLYQRSERDEDWIRTRECCGTTTTGSSTNLRTDHKTRR